MLGGDNSIICLEKKRTEHHISDANSSSECRVSDGQRVPENASQEFLEDETNLSVEIEHHPIYAKKSSASDKYYKHGMSSSFDSEHCPVSTRLSSSSDTYGIPVSDDSLLQHYNTRGLYDPNSDNITEEGIEW